MSAFHTDRATRQRAARQSIICGFPPRHVHTLEESEGHLDPEQIEATVEISRVCRAGGIGIVNGTYGNGKTHLAAWYGIGWNLRGYSLNHGKCRHWTTSALMAAQKSWFSKKDATPEPFQQAKDCGLLFIDELDATNDTVFDQRELKQLLDWRYSQGNKPTILLTNLPPDRLSDAIDISILDRVMDGGGLIELKGASKRGQ